MNILFSIGKLMVVSMVGSPPDRALLSGGRSEKCQDKLKETTCLIRPVREIAVVDPGDCKHAEHVQRHTYRECCPTKSDNEYQQASEMDRPEGRLLDDVKRVEGVSDGAHVDITTDKAF
jgi:hypothetical protein